jgi:hypothetical protein
MTIKFSQLRETLTIPAGGYVIGYDPTYTGAGSKNFRIGANKLAPPVSTGGVTTEQFLDLVELMTTTSIVQGGTFFSDTFATNAGINALASTRAVFDSTNKKITPTTKDASALLHFNGTQGSTTVTDVNGHIFTLAANGGTARIDTSRSVFGGSSLLLSSGFSNGATVSTPTSPDFGVGTGDFTMECFINNTTGDGVIGSTQSIVNGLGFTLYQKNNGFLQFVDASGTANTTFSGTSTITGVNAWRHVAAVRKDGVLSLYYNGVREFTGPLTRDYGSSAPIRIGTRPDLGDCWTGYMDEFRFTKGAKYQGATITPPTSEIVPTPPNSAYTLVSTAWTATAVPTKISLRVQARTLVGITEPAYILNTDMTASVSRDGGTTWTPLTLTAQYTRPDGNDVLTGTADVSAQPSGKNIVYRFDFLNGRLVEVGSVIQSVS